MFRSIVAAGTRSLFVRASLSSWRTSASWAAFCASESCPGGMILQTTLPPSVTSTPFASIASERINFLTAGDAASTLMRVIEQSPRQVGVQQVGHLRFGLAVL